MWNFKADEPAKASIAVPFIEDATAKTAPFYSSGKSIEQAKADVVEWFDVLGAGILSFQSGVYEINKQKRFGFVIRFTLNVDPFNGMEGVIRVAGLPMRSPTPAKEKQVKVQALLNIAEQLRTAYTSRLFSPDSHPLVPNLLIPGKDGQVRTVTEAITYMINAPQLESGLI